MKTLLVDADITVFKICSAAQEEFHWDEEHTTLYSNFKECKNSLDSALTNLKEKLQADDMILCFSDKANFRKTVYPEYKANRKESVKPMNLTALRNYAKDKYTSKQLPNLEADDVLGILATGEWIKGEKVIVSLDKDLKQIPGKLARPSYTGMEFLEISEPEAMLAFYSQVLLGDATDNYPGCPRVGPKGVEKALNLNMEPEEMWQAVVALYEKAELTEYDAIIQARCAKILQRKDYNMEEKQVLLWMPPTINEETLEKLGAA